MYLENQMRTLTWYRYCFLNRSTPRPLRQVEAADSPVLCMQAWEARHQAAHSLSRHDCSWSVDWLQSDQA